MVQEIHNCILPNAPPILPHVPFAALKFADDISSLHSTPMQAPLSPPRKKVNRSDESPSASLHRTTGDSQIESCTSLNLGACDMDTPRRLEQ
jgi:hypothetical protein